VVTGVASGVSASGATLAGQLNPNGQAASYHFEYGTSSAYGSATPVQQVVPALTPAAVSGMVGALAPGGTYHFRLVASNADGITFGADETFTTVGAQGASGPPRFLSVSVHPRVFHVQRVGRAGRRGRHRRPAATTFRYSLSQDARVLFTIQRILPGRRVGKPRRFAVNAVAGPNATRFSGRIGGRALAPGRYRVTLIAIDAAGRRSAPRLLTFRIVHP
jgi:hypothetical protein